MGDNSKGEEKLTPSLHLLNENRSGGKRARRMNVLYLRRSFWVAKRNLEATER